MSAEIICGQTNSTDRVLGVETAKTETYFKNNDPIHEQV